MKRGKQRLLVTIGKIVAQSKSASHVGRKNGPKIRFRSRSWKNELFCNAVHPLSGSANTNPEDWGIAC